MAVSRAKLRPMAKDSFANDRIFLVGLILTRISIPILIMVLENPVNTIAAGTLVFTLGLGRMPESNIFPNQSTIRTMY